MCTGGGLEKDVLVALLSTLVNEWDKAIAVPAADSHEEGHRHGVLQCRNQVATLIGLKELAVQHD